MTTTKRTCFHNGRLLNGIWNIFTTWPNDQFQMNCSTCQITPASRCAICPTSLSTCCMINTPWWPHLLHPARARPIEQGFVAREALLDVAHCRLLPNTNRSGACAVPLALRGGVPSQRTNEPRRSCLL